MSRSEQILIAAEKLRGAVDELTFSSPIDFVYNPLGYAWLPHKKYIERFADHSKKAVFLGMNPGPWGMAQTGIPFGEINAVKNWMKIEAPVGKPDREHPKRPILGFECEKSEVSGKRLWGLFQEQFDSADHFFEDHFVINFCPLVFMEASSRNFTPDKLPAAEAKPLLNACQKHLKICIEALEPEWVVGVGGFAQKMIKDSLSDHNIQQGKVLHPSPASPAANRGWAEAALTQLRAQGIWK